MLSCYQCSLKFDQNVWYDLHVSLVHSQEDEIEILKPVVKKFPRLCSVAKTVPLFQKKAAAECLKQLLDAGVIKEWDIKKPPPKLVWPAFFTPKPSGKLRLVTNF